MKGFLVAAAVGLSVTGGASAGPLDALRWQKRVVLVFGQGDAERTNAQRRALADENGSKERDLLIVEVPQSGTVRIPSLGSMDAATLHRGYSVADDASFTVLLIGKDGGVKRRADEPMTAENLFATIDAMPMRASEMRRE